MKNETGKSRVFDIKTSMHAGYMYDMPIIRKTLKSYTTMLTNSMVLNISNDKIIE